MSSNEDKREMVVFFITYSKHSMNHRMKLLLGLKSRFNHFVLVTMNPCLSESRCGHSGSLLRRVKNILIHKRPLSSLFVDSGAAPEQYDHVVVNRIRNPLGLLSRCGPSSVRQKIERYLFFPSPRILCIWPAVRKLRKMIEQYIQEDKRVCVLNSLPLHDMALVGLVIHIMIIGHNTPASLKNRISQLGAV